MESAPIPPAAVEAQLERMLRSATFRSAERSRRLLRFVVEQTLQGRADRLKDYTLGAEALGRGETFDPRIDPIARVEASRLRSRLDVYYATEGAGDQIRVLLPKGGYVPVFEARPASPEPASPAPSGVEQTEPVPPGAERSAPTRVNAVRPGAARRSRSLAVAATVVVVAGGWYGAGGWLSVRGARGIRTLPEMHLEITTPPSTDPVSVAMAPDGESVVFIASAGGIPQLWIRRLDTPTPRPLPGTQHAALPFWAPDGRSVGFFAGGRISAIELQTGLVRTLSSAPVPAGAAWNADGVILHPLVPDSPLFRTSASGGALVPATELVAGQTGHRAPVFLPDGRRFVFYALGNAATRGIHVGELGTTATRRLRDADAPATLLAPDYLLVVQGGTLFAYHLDVANATLAGDPVPLAEHVMADAGTGLAAVSTSATGTIAYRTGSVGVLRQLVWFDRGGTQLSRVGASEIRGPLYGSISPDGRRLAVQRAQDGNTDIWVMDLERGTSIRFTSEPQADIAPIWSPRGDRIAYGSQLDGLFQLFDKPLSGDTARLLLRTAEAKQITDWARDGRHLLYRTVTPKAGGEMDMDVWALALDGGSAPVAVARTPFEERDAQFSPDGRWIAYQSNESGRHEVYLQPFREMGERVRISASGGAQVRWRADGRELFYLSPEGELMAVPLAWPAGTRTVQAGAPVRLFRAGAEGGHGISLPSYVVSPDGKRFLIDMVVEQQPAPISLILNWRRHAR